MQHSGDADEQAHRKQLAFLAGGGEMGERLRTGDWTQSPLGPPEAWPQSLKTCVRIVLTSRQPMFVWWGSELINLYNDAYKSIVGGKHPLALGQPASVVWREIWDQVGPRAERTMRGDEGTYDEALLLIMERNGYPEETYYTFSYSPVPNDQGGVGGLICANTDDTQRIIGSRQLALLRELAARGADAHSVEEACERALQSLASDPWDFPFALLYLADVDARGSAREQNNDRRSLRLMGALGLAAGHPAAPLAQLLDEPSFWPLAEVFRTQGVQIVEQLQSAFPDLPSGAWPRSPVSAAALPIAPSGESGRGGVLLVGLNPFRLFDDSYQGFLDLVAGQVAATIARAEAYAQERQRAEALAEIDRAKTTFFSNISHEFRTPLTLMLGPLEDAMQSDRPLSPENLTTAYRNALRLLKLVNALLDFSRIEANRTDASFEPTDLAALTADLASAFRSALERAGLNFDVRVPALAEPIYVDHDMWEKIVLNLLSNAFKFTFGGGIQVELGLAGACVELRVRDSGTGIAPSELPHLFERFHRVQGARARTHEGSGIGLALVHELVRMHGGSISVSSELGVGTTFCVEIPRGSAHLAPERVRAQSTRPAAGPAAAAFVYEAERWLPDPTLATPPSAVTELTPPSGAPVEEVRVLLADDNADMRDYLSRLLRERFQVEAVADGSAALAAALRAPPDLILSDVMMPKLDGFGLLRALRADPRTRAVPVIMLSARAGEESRVEGLEAGADDYLIKPFGARELLARIAARVEIARLRMVAERERQRLYEVFMQTPAPVAVFAGEALRFEVANPAYCEMVGRTDLIGKTLREVFPEGDGSLFESLTRVVRSGEALHLTELNVTLVRAGFRENAYFNYVVQPWKDASGQVTGIVTVGFEVTEQVIARRQVENLRNAAEQASRAKDEFLSTLSHELRTPLSAIVGWSSLLRKGGVAPERHDRALETIERNAQAQARLIEDMLDLSRIEQGKLLLSVGPLEMVRVVEAALDTLRPAAEAKGVRLQPVLDSHATIVGDADRLQQVIWNLLSNAIKFTPRGGRVHVRLARHQSCVEVVVSDTGQGIEPNFLPHVFDRFRQADPSFTRRTGGLGLGLAIVRSLVQLHGGTVSASSEGQGRGATFSVQLPTAPLRADRLASPAEPARNDEKPKRASFECPPVLRGVRMLVVDDEPETRELVQYMLEQCGVQVTAAASAREALAVLQHEVFDVLVTDIGMPDVDGFTLIRSVRALPGRLAAIPALALTAYARGEDRAEALRAGFDMHVAKPIEPGELLVVIAALVSGHQRRS